MLGVNSIDYFYSPMACVLWTEVEFWHSLGCAKHRTSRNHTFVCLECTQYFFAVGLTSAYFCSFSLPITMSHSSAAVHMVTTLIDFRKYTQRRLTIQNNGLEKTQLKTILQRLNLAETFFTFKCFFLPFFIHSYSNLQHSYGFLQMQNSRKHSRFFL